MSPACAERTPWLTDMLEDMSDGMVQVIEKKVLKANDFSGELGKLAEEY